MLILKDAELFEKEEGFYIYILTAFFLLVHFFLSLAGM